MEFKINPKSKTVTILNDVNVGELFKFLTEFLREDFANYKIVVETVNIPTYIPYQEPIIKPYVQPYDQAPYSKPWWEVFPGTICYGNKSGCEFVVSKDSATAAIFNSMN